MYRQRPAFCFAMLVLVGVAAAAVASAEENPQLGTILGRMEQAQQQNSPPPYTVTREYRFYASSTEDAPKSEVTASVSFVPPHQKTFAIESATGAKRGEKIVERILQSEAKASRENSSTLNRGHYDFALLGEDIIDGHRCWVLHMQAKHPEKDLFNGRAWVDQNSYLIRRIDGDMSRLPSWWLKSVHVTVSFDSAAGVWVQTRTRAVADVRIFGTHILTGDAISVRTAEATANLRPPAIGLTPEQGSSPNDFVSGRNGTGPNSSTAPLVGTDVLIPK